MRPERNIRVFHASILHVCLSCFGVRVVRSGRAASCHHASCSCSVILLVINVQPVCASASPLTAFSLVRIALVRTAMAAVVPRNPLSGIDGTCPSVLSAGTWFLAASHRCDNELLLIPQDSIVFVYGYNGVVYMYSFNICGVGCKGG